MTENGLPQKWNYQSIGELCDLINGRAFKPTEWSKEGLPIVRIQNLNDETKPFNYFNGKAAEKNLINNGDVLLSWSGTPGTSFGCFYWNGGEAVLNQHIFKVIVDEQKCDKEFFIFAVNNILDEMIAQAHGGVGLRHITKGKLEQLNLAIAPLEEQRRIVGRIKECLSRVDEIKKLREESRKDAESLEETIFGDFLEDAQRDGCEVVNLGDVLTKAQYGTSAKATADGEGFPVLRMGNIKSGHFDFSDLKYMKLSDAELEKYRLNIGDILINRTNSMELVGKSAVFQKEEGDWVFASYLVRLVVDSSKAIPEFVNASINSRIGRAYVYATARRAIGMVNINAKEIAKMPLPLPSLEKQAQIVSQIKEARIASQSLLEELEIKSIELLSNSILRKAFAGEL